MRRIVGILMLAAGLTGSSAQAGMIGFDAKYVVDASGLAAGNYWLDWFVSVGTSPYVKGTVEVGGVTLAGSGVLLGPGLAGSPLVSGALNGVPPLRISNDFDSLAAPMWNSAEYSHFATVDGGLSFNLHMEFDQPAVGAGTVVVFSIFTDAGGAPGGVAFDTKAGDGGLGQVDYLPGVGFQFTALELTSGGTVMTQKTLGPAEVPEPAVWPLVGVALALAGLSRRRG